MNTRKAPQAKGSKVSDRVKVPPREQEVRAHKEHDPARHRQKVMRNALKSGGIFNARHLADQNPDLKSALDLLCEGEPGKISELAKKAVGLSPEEVAAWLLSRQNR